jgi:SAM-dependent methyltransferase
MQRERRRIARYVVGEGLEVGAGHQPFPLPSGATVRYVDRWSPDENRELFPELGAADFPEPDVVANFDVDRLSAFADSSQDFIIASHVLEHLADPLGFLDELHRVLRPGGLLVLLLPDRRRTFDRDRSATSLVHLIGEHDSGVIDVSDEHVEEFLDATMPGWRNGVDQDEAVPSHTLDFHRRRSIHVHCWTESEFDEVLLHSTDVMGHRWELIDAVTVDDEGPEGFEFGFVLSRGIADVAPHVRTERLRAAIGLLRARRWEALELASRLAAAEAEASAASARASALQVHVDHWESRTRLLRRAPVTWFTRFYRTATRATDR